MHPVLALHRILFRLDADDAQFDQKIRGIMNRNRRNFDYESAMSGACEHFDISEKGFYCTFSFHFRFCPLSGCYDCMGSSPMTVFL